MSGRLSPQQAKLLKALRQAGRRGVHSHECREHLHLGDPARRVADLRQQGFVIHSKLERRNGAHGTRYVLMGPATGVGGSQSAPDPGVRPDTQYLSLVESTPPRSPHRASSAPSRVVPRPGGVDGLGRPVWFVPRNARYQLAPAPDCVWVVDANPMSPLYGKSYWRGPLVAEAAQEQMAVAA